MNRTFRANTPKTIAWGRLFGLLVGESAILGLFFFLGSDPARRVDFAHLGRWLDTTPPVDAVVAVALLIGAFGAFWLFATSMLYIAARVFAMSSLEAGSRRFILPTVRRMIDGAFAIGIAGSSLFGSAQMAHAAMRTPAPIVAQVDARSDAAIATYADGAADAAPAADEVPTPADDAPAPVESTSPPSAPAADGADTPTPAEDGAVAPAPATDAPAPTPPAPETPPATSDPVLTRPGAPTEDATPGDDGVPSAAGDSDTIKDRPAEPSSGPSQDAPAPTPADDSGATTTTTIPLVRPDAPATQTPSVPDTGDVPTPQVGGIATTVRRYTVVKGDNFWTIAAREVRNSTGHNPTNEEVRRYWIALIEANRSNISSGNPNLIYAGEEFVLPPVA